MDRQTLHSQIDEALQAHTIWKTKLRGAVKTGRLPKPARDIACDDQCGFGKWLIRLKSDPDVTGKEGYRLVAEAHTAFHRVAGDVASKVEAGQADAASALLEGPAFQNATSTLRDRLVSWKRTG